MNIIDIVKRIKNLILILDNKELFNYRIHHYIKRKVSLTTALKYAKKNIEFYKERNISTIWIDTYENSKQICHPDICIWNKKYWLIGTPYPYGLEEYENPCLYSGETINSLIPIFNKPIAFPSKKGYGSHLSDPCLYANSKNLFCFYRDTINNKTEIENRICYKKIINNKLGSEKVIITSKEDALLSPAVITENGKIYMYYVSKIKNEFSLKRIYLTNDFKIISKETMKVHKKDNDFIVWHISIQNVTNKIQGLFLMRNIKKLNEFKLEIYNLDYNNNCFEYYCDVKIPKELDDIILHPYKSCFIPNSEKKILLSFRDVNAVYVLKEIYSDY